MKRVLLTNAFIKNYSGSELDTIEVANYFIQNGYNVDIFTLEKGEPLLSQVNKKIRVLTYKDIDKLHKKYDILWSHHFPLVDYLIFNTNIEFDYVHHLCLSFYEAYEQLPVYYKELNLVSAMSDKCRDEIVSNNKLVNEKNISVFPNYSKLSYFNKDKKISENIKKIAIVSNHIPKELLEFKKLAQKENVEVDIYGQGYKYVKIDDNILLDYDVIISIGKTCYYSIALGIPTYIYDRFGGDGYITPININISYQNNFSGRAFRKQMSAKEILNDIISEYPKISSTIKECKEFGFKNFCFENNIEKVLKKLMSTPELNKDEIISKYPQLLKTGKLFVEQVGSSKDIIEYFKDGCLKSNQLFYDTANGFNEKESIKKESKLIGRNVYEVEFKLPNNCEKIRFDICEKELVEIKNIKLNDKKFSYTTENIKELNNKMISVNNDPYIIINKKFKKNDKIKFSYELKEIEPIVIFDELNILNQKNKNNEDKIENLTTELNIIKNSKSYKLASKIRRIIRRR